MSNKDTKPTSVAAAAASTTKASVKTTPQEPAHISAQEAIDGAQSSAKAATAPVGKAKEHPRSQGMDEIYIHTAAGPVSMRLTEEEIASFRTEVMRQAAAAATKEMLGVEETKHILNLERHAAEEATKNSEVASRQAEHLTKEAKAEREKLEAAVESSKQTIKKTALGMAINIAGGVVVGAVMGVCFAFGTKVAGGASIKLKQ